MAKKEKRPMLAAPPTEGEYETKTIPSPAPYYAAAVTLLFYACAFPLHTWFQYLLCGGLTGFVTWLAGKIAKPKTVYLPLPRAVPVSGDAEADRVIREAEAALGRTESAAGEIAMYSPRLSGTAIRLVKSGRGILDALAREPAKSALLRRFFSYYLPTLEKLLQSYLYFSRLTETTEETRNSRREIEDAVEEMEKVFELQHKKLMSDAVLDITTDIDVLDAMLEGDGIQSDLRSGTVLDLSKTKEKEKVPR